MTILWRRPDRPGHEACRLVSDAAGHRLEGSAVCAHEGEACRLDYAVTCDAAWRTVSAKVAGWIGATAVDIVLAADAGSRWTLNGTPQRQVEGCVDLDLNFSPSTNLLPIRRLSLPIGRESPVRAAWLRFPGFTLEPLYQLYRRLSDGTYRYESAGGRFVAELDVQPDGFVTRYPGFCEIDGSAANG